MASAEDEFTALYRTHYDAVERYVRRRAEPDAVRDVVADVFTIAWRRRDELPAERLPWLYSVARRVLANSYRGRDRARALIDRLEAQPASGNADHAESWQARVDLARALAALGEDDREVLRLVAWEQLSTADAARALGCSVPALAMRLLRARRRLAHHLDDSSPRQPLESPLTQPNLRSQS